MYTQDFIESLDAHDNGISAYPSNIAPLYKVSPTALPQRVGKLNPNWNEKLSDPEIDVSLPFLYHNFCNRLTRIKLLL